MMHVLGEFYKKKLEYKQIMYVCWHTLLTSGKSRVDRVEAASQRLGNAIFPRRRDGAWTANIRVWKGICETGCGGLCVVDLGARIG